MTSIKPIHPFPARMAPEIALEHVNTLPENSVVLDPMTGSGTVVRTACEQGHRGLGFDSDPLAVLMTKVWTKPIDTEILKKRAEQLVRSVRNLSPNDISLPWIDEDEETKDYINFWFVDPQKADLRRLSHGLMDLEDDISDALRIALSRLIITKDKGASLAGDVSHSRPHRIRATNDFKVMDQFLRSAGTIGKRLRSQPPRGNVEVSIGDARALSDIEDSSVDAVITSPPYLNALDYMRGHKLSLVWLGHRVVDLRPIRSNSIGAQRGPDKSTNTTDLDDILTRLEGIECLPRSETRMFKRYVIDLIAMLKETYRTLTDRGKAVFVIGNSCLRNVFIDNASAVSLVAEKVGLSLTSRKERVLPPNRRYLPPPASSSNAELEKRMSSEVVLCFSKA